jgi:hypothetical protein
MQRYMVGTFKLYLADTCQVNGSSPFNVPDMYPPVSRGPCPQCQASQDSSETDVHYSEGHVDSSPGGRPIRSTFVDAAVQCLPFDDHHCDRSSRGSTPPGDTTQGFGSVHTPPSQRYVQSRILGRPEPPEERDDQDGASEPRSQSQSPSPPATQHDPKNPSHILKVLRRDVGGGATCVWQHGGAECGFSSQIDLVKRHIKRVHYRLR